MPKPQASSAPNEQWLETWLDAVRDGKLTMSQRSRSWIDAHGGIDLAIATARERDVHLLELTDDTGKLLVAASRHPFRAICSHQTEPKRQPLANCHSAPRSLPVQP